MVCFLQTYKLNLHGHLQLPVPEKCKALKPLYCDVSPHLEDVNALQWYTVHTTVLYMTGKILRDDFSPFFLRNTNKLTNAELMWCQKSKLKTDPQQRSCAFLY